MKLDEEFMLADELPGDARKLLANVETTVANVRTHTEQQLAAARDAAEREIQAIRDRLAIDEARIQTQSSRELSPVLKDVFLQLKQLQVQYTQNGQLDEALAIRCRLRAIRCDLFGVKPDPGNLTSYSSSDCGKSFLFDVVGTTDGSVWGTDAYTGDSSIAVASVHSGVLRPGERGLIRVTVFDGSESIFEGSERHGIRSHDYGNFTVAFAVERA